MDNNDETRKNRESSPADKAPKRETGPRPKEDPIKEFQEYLLDIGIRL